MKKEYDFTHARRAVFHSLPPEPERARHTKIRITIMLDQDVLNFFKAKAASPGAEPYQTQINQALREYVAAGGRPLKDDLLKDQSFVARLAMEVARYPATKQARRSRTSQRKTS